MFHERIEQAAHNNAIWCDTVCRAHGRSGAFHEALWLTWQAPPPFYPSAVTLQGTKGITAQLGYIQRLIDTGAADSVKDSFYTLDLLSKGFDVLFEAEWIYRSASLPKPDVEIAGVHRKKISRASELAAWEAAWNREPAAEHEPLFLPSLLSDDNVAILAAYYNQTLVAGAIANCTGEVVGISNIFLPAAEPEQYLAVCLAMVVDVFPNLPLVGYESGEDLVRSVSMGFESIGPLRIWTRSTP